MIGAALNCHNQPWHLQWIAFGGLLHNAIVFLVVAPVAALL